MIDKDAQDLALLCEVVGDNIVDFVEELRAVDLVDLVSFIRFESFPTIEDLVNSSTELFFQADMLMFSWTAAVDLRWDALPLVTLGLEFRHPEVSVFFNLTLGGGRHVVDVLSATFEHPCLGPSEDLAQAFAEARLSGAPRPVVPGIRADRRARKGLPWP